MSEKQICVDDVRKMSPGVRSRWATLEGYIKEKRAERVKDGNTKEVGEQQ